ncbi:hypothetical protein KX729_22245 [Rhizobium sp. XQZ8]|uniref:hypothetical protein n=1 Tax=Rhizobium populisoli TaxID=2859785 RepID=UPI001CA4EC4A|nr:hypothetical protein [Rhizobium populisoli]MBW6424188.1 hypothetical protein [Rhizobium populisoli]
MDAFRLIAGITGTVSSIFTWISRRVARLTSGEFDELIVRPVHARMLCQIATNPEIELHQISKYGLFDQFVHFLLDREVRKRGRDGRFSLPVRRRFNASVAAWLWRQGGASTVSISHIPNSLFATAAEGVQHDYDDPGLRRELTQGCLVDKNGTTVFFNHRSLQEFLVANAIVEISSVPSFQSSNLLDCLRLLNAEIANFLLGGYCESDVLRTVLDRWFTALIGLEGQLSVVALRLLTQLRMEGASKTRLSPDDPWHRWISFFMSNGGVSYDLKSDSHNPHELAKSNAQRFLSDYVSDIARYDSPRQAAALTLLASVLRAKRDQAESQYATVWLANWLSFDLFEKAFAKTKGKGKYALVYVQRDEDFALWLFVKCCRLERVNNEMNVVIDLKLMKEFASSHSPIGIIEDIAVETDVSETMLPVQVLYRIWGTPERKLETVRPFFFKTDHMEKLKTLDTIVRSSSLSVASLPWKSRRWLQSAKYCRCPRARRAFRRRNCFSNRHALGILGQSSGCEHNTQLKSARPTPASPKRWPMGVNRHANLTPYRRPMLGLTHSR